MDRHVLVALTATAYAVILINSCLTYFLPRSGMPLHVGPHCRMNYTDSTALVLLRDLAWSNYYILSV